MKKRDLLYEIARSIRSVYDKCTFEAKCVLYLILSKVELILSYYNEMKELEK